MGLVIIEVGSDADVVWWVELAKKLAVVVDYRFGDAGGFGLEKLAEYEGRNESIAEQSRSEKKPSKNRLNFKLAKRCAKRKR